GTLITGPNGNSIFMPAAGFWSNNHYCEEGTTCAYWCNSLCFQFGHYTNSYAGSTLFRYDNFPSSCAGRSLGYTVRPVRAFPQGSQTTEIPSVQTMSVSNIMVNNATLNGIVVTGEADLLSLGFVYGTSENNLSCIIECAIVDGDYTATLVGLSSGTTYYYKAFATNSAGTAYGEVMSFETEQQDGPEISYFSDSRDGNTYAMVTIGNQTWMAENLRYAYGIDVGLSSSTTVAYRFYPNGASSNVGIYGYLYNWSAAMNGENSSAENPSGVQGICPSGWHLPSNSEWQQLCDALGGNNLDVHYNNPGSQLAGHAELWDDGFLDRAENFGVTGFDALPAGGYSPSDGGYYFGFDGCGCAYFWSSTELEESANHVRVWRMNCASTSFANNYYTKDWGYSVRCVLNE
ncbi:MAG: hypothetical protein II471_02505, partial [Bacteroidales bacterium]|nr:hypothetical protein [Bacteroidales bacterium]